MTTRNLGDLRAPQIAELLTPASVIVQPLGAIEQHGPHLPIGTDWMVAQAVARSLAEELGARRKYLEVLKMRGTNHQTGKHSIDISRKDGIVVLKARF